MRTPLTNMRELGAQPSVSVIMPVRDEERYIRRSLRSVLTQDYAQDRVEVIVADGMSSAATRLAIRELQADHANLYLVDNPGRIAASGLNAAISMARGDVIVRVDGHCEVARDYLTRCVEHLRTRGVVGVGGPIETVGETPLAHAIAIAMSSRFGVGGSPFRTLKGRTLIVDTVPFPAYTREAIDRAGPYDEELVRNQDDEYNYRLRSLGGKILLASDVCSLYYSRSNLRALWRQFFQYGYWKVRVMQKHPRQMRPRQFVPVCFVLGLLCGLLIVPISSVGGWLFGSLVGSYLVVNLLASTITTRGERAGTIAIMPLIFAVLHLSYGLGFLIGLGAFWNRWNDKSVDQTARS